MEKDGMFFCSKRLKKRNKNGGLREPILRLRYEYFHFMMAGVFKKSAEKAGKIR